MMGSPVSEEGRGSTETQYQVTLSRGFWQSVDKFSNWGICVSYATQSKTFLSRKVPNFGLFDFGSAFLFGPSSLLWEFVDGL